MKRYTGRKIRDYVSAYAHQVQYDEFAETEFYKADDVKQLLTDIYWNTTCDMTRQYLQNKTNIDFEKALKDK